MYLRYNYIYLSFQSRYCYLFLLIYFLIKINLIIIKFIESRLKFYWDMIYLISLIATSFYTPLKFSFNIDCKK
jgi:hypothetical protein